MIRLGKVSTETKCEKTVLPEPPGGGPLEPF